jgi:hypothetical protein
MAALGYMSDVEREGLGVGEESPWHRMICPSCFANSLVSFLAEDLEEAGS